MANNILMIGCGDVGLRLAHALIDKGHQLTIIKRSPLTGIKATVIEQDISQSFSLNGLAPDYVFIILSPSAQRQKPINRFLWRVSKMWRRLYKAIRLNGYFLCRQPVFMDKMQGSG
jgi:nucleoside-diphosphate-sugar epimerase